MKKLQGTVMGLVVGCVLVTQGAWAESANPLISTQIDELFADWDSSTAPGIVAAVIQDGRIVYENAFGMADLERGVALSPRSALEIGSISKQFTAACVLHLVHPAARE